MEDSGPPDPPNRRQEGSLEGRLLRAFLEQTEEYAQGYLLSRPQPADELGRWLRRRSALRDPARAA